MIKALIGFAIFAAIALWIFIKAGADVHIGGETHDVSGPAGHAASAPASAASQ